MFELLTLARVCPIHSQSPWQVRHVDGIDKLQRDLSELQLFYEDRGRASMRKFWAHARTLAGV